MIGSMLQYQQGAYGRFSVRLQNIDKFLWYPEGQRPLVFQLGGSDPQTLAQAARKVAEFGYDEINLNCGCPR